MEKYNWNTEFITAEDLMVHTFPDTDVKVETNIKTGAIRVLLSGEEVDTPAPMSCFDYEQFVLRTAEWAINNNSINH